MIRPVSLRPQPSRNRSGEEKADQIDQGSASTTGTSDRKSDPGDPITPPTATDLHQLGSLRRHHRRQRAHPAAWLPPPSQTNASLETPQPRTDRSWYLPKDARPIRAPSHGRDESVSASSLASDDQLDLDGRDLLLAAAEFRHEQAGDARW